MVTDAARGDFGARLREAREARGVSLREIANATKIAIGVLEAIERNDFSKLPGGIFSRAFVRAYAQEVGLDPDEAVAEFLAALPADSPSARLHAPPRIVDQDEAVFESRQRMAMVGLKLVLVSVPIAGLLLYLSIGRAGPAASRSAPSRSAASSPMSPAFPPIPAPSSPTGESGVSSAAGQAPVGQVAPEGRGPGAAAAPAAPSGASEGFALEIAPVDACWISLTVDGRLVLERVVRAGERIVQRVRDEAALHVGDAGAFAFSINGRPGRPVGARGEVKRLRIARDTYETWLR